MYLPLLPALAVLSYASLTRGLLIRAYANALSCSGSYQDCDAWEWRCCWFPNPYGLSLKFHDLPSGTKGQAYSGNDCHDYLGVVYGENGSTDKCWNGGNNRGQQANWFYQWSPRRSLNNNTDTCVEESTPVASQECNVVLPHSFTYPSADGKERTIKLPADKQEIEHITALYMEGDLDSLSLYEDA